MAKRRRGSDGKFLSGGSATGGTGDLKPQILTMTTPSPIGASDYSVARIPLPRLVLGGVNTATIVEMLRVDWYFGIENLSDAAVTHWGFLATSTNRTQDEGASLNQLVLDIQDPRTFAIGVWDTFTTGTSGSRTQQLPVSIDLTDNNGNGVLVATDSIFIVGADAGAAILTPTMAKVLYRMVNVGITEYVGIVAGMQGP